MEESQQNGLHQELELFEGMVLTVPSEFDTRGNSLLLNESSSIGVSSVSQPLDENLFSDLNICYAIDDQTVQSQEITTACASDEKNSFSAAEVNQPSVAIQRPSSHKDNNDIKKALSRQWGSRRKKKSSSFKIGYGRYDTDDILYEDHTHRSTSNIDSNPAVSYATLPKTQVQSLGNFPNVQTQESEVESSNITIPERASADAGVREDIIDINANKVAVSEDMNASEDGIPEGFRVPADLEEKKEDYLEDRGSEMKNVEEFNLELPQHAAANIDVLKVSEIAESDKAEESACRPNEKRLVHIKQQMMNKLKELQKMASSLSLSRKATAQRRRKAAQELAIVSDRHRELEKELEEACEMEDFEKAEKLSESIAAAEKMKEETLLLFKEAESDCDKMTLKMHEILEMQIGVEEEGIQMLQSLNKDAIDLADLTIKEAEMTTSREMVKWQADKEAVEIKKMECNLELKIIEDAKMDLKQSIDDSVGKDIEEKNTLAGKQEILKQELEILLALVRAKEEEISENELRIEAIENRISIKLSQFEEHRTSVKATYEGLQLLWEQLEDHEKVLSTKKIDIDLSLTKAGQQRLELLQLAEEANKEVAILQDMLNMRKSIALSFLHSCEGKVKLAEKERQITEEIHNLRQKVTDARVYLQELQSTKVTCQQAVQSMKQRISFIKRRLPELEAEKKIAAAARNFKEAGRVASEAKAFLVENDTISSDMEQTLTELQRVEDEIERKVVALQEDESLIISKEREAAMARCERLRLVAASARDERSIALELEDPVEADNLLAEADAADSEADKLQDACNFEGDQFLKRSNQTTFIGLGNTLYGKQSIQESFI